jgi:hypothetical protein
MTDRLFTDYGGNLSQIFSEYPLINSNVTNSFRGDGINVTEIVNFIFKKQFGIPNTNPYIDYSGESYIDSLLNASKDRQYSQIIPYDYPIDIYIDLNFPNTMNDNLNVNNQYRYISSNYPYLSYYSNIIMSPSSVADNGEVLSFYVLTPNSNILTKNAVSYSYGLKSVNAPARAYYNTIRLKASDGTNLNFGASPAGNWIFDTDSGIVTFYDNPTVAQVNGDNPPRISFWRYEGLIGNNTVMNVGDF